MAETVKWLRSAGLPGVEALHADFERHAYRPHSHPTGTVAVMERGAAQFTVDDRFGPRPEGRKNVQDGRR